MSHYLLSYEKGAGWAERQAPLAAGHLAHLKAAVERGELLVGGNLLDPSDGGALLLFRADSEAPVEAFAAADPYVTGGVVSRWTVRGWDTVIGPLAERAYPG
jgi:uncharacterized protein YciI